MKIIIILLLFFISACSQVDYKNNDAISDSNVISSSVKASQAMVVTANPLASQAGAKIIRQGGSAVDAAIAIEAVLSLVEPQSSGLGGGGFMTYFDNKTKQVSVYDGREIAPENVNPNLFIKENGEPFGFIEAKNSGLSIGVPGMVSLLQLAHEDHGKLTWSENFNQAKTLAVEGFAISPRLHESLLRFKTLIPQKLSDGPVDAFQYFYAGDGEAYPVGHILKNSAYAKALDLIANDPHAFYHGEIANEIIQQVIIEPRAGSMQKTDLSNYAARREQALCTTFREKTLCGPPPPSSWIAVAMTMNILERLPMPSTGSSGDVNNWRLFTEAQRLAYIDRDQYIADPDFIDVPILGMLNDEYLDQRAALISLEKVNNEISWGDPWAFQELSASVQQNGVDSTVDAAGTTHFVVVDLEGNVVSLTASVESFFGSTRMAAGMFLNNQLTDYSFRSHDRDGNLIANSVAAGKRPRSSMSPTIVLDENGEFLMATGSPGGNSIIAYTAKTLVGVLDWNLSPQNAIELPNVIARPDKVSVEKTRASDVLISGLNSFGYQVDESNNENSGLSIILKDSEGNLVGGVDSRREGTIEMINLAN